MNEVVQDQTALESFFTPMQHSMLKFTRASEAVGVVFDDGGSGGDIDFAIRDQTPIG